jgi:hypothetical protein
MSTGRGFQSKKRNVAVQCHAGYSPCHYLRAGAQAKHGPTLGIPSSLQAVAKHGPTLGIPSSWQALAKQSQIFASTPALNNVLMIMKFSCFGFLLLHSHHATTCSCILHSHFYSGPPFGLVVGHWQSVIPNVSITVDFTYLSH